MSEQILDATELAAMLGAHIEPQAEGSKCYTCNSALTAEGNCQFCNERLGRLKVKHAIRILNRPGQVVEVRAFPKTEGACQIGYFNDRSALADALAQLEESGLFKAIYTTLNPVLESATVGSPVNSVGLRTNATTDAQIASRRWLLVDLDPVRKSGTSSTDAELWAAQDTAREVERFLSEQGWPLPHVATSGNGMHLLYNLSLPNTDEVTDAVNGVLNVLHRKFSNTQVEVDRAVGNASRITRAYGTTNRKGVDAAERPWRGSDIITKGRTVSPVSLEQLQQLAATEPAPAGRGDREGGLSEDFDIEDFCEHFELTIRNPEGEEKADGRRWFYLDECPFAGRTHSGDRKKTALVVGDSLGFHCFSDECSDHGLGDLLSLLATEHGRYRGQLFDSEDDATLPDFWANQLDPEDEASAPEVANPVDAFDAEAPMVIEDAEVPSVLPVEVIEPVASSDPTELDFEELRALGEATPPPSKIRNSPFPVVAQKEKGRLAIPDDAMYGWLQQKTQEMNCPPTWGYVSLMAMFAAQGVNMDDDGFEVRPTIFACLIGPPGMGKSVTMKRAEGSFCFGRWDMIKRNTPGSDRGLINIFSPKKKKDEEEEYGLKSYLLLQDEFKNTLKKMEIQGSALANTLTSLYYENEAGSADKTGTHTAIMRLNILGGLAVADPSEFTEMFGSETCAGLYDRFIFAPAVAGWEYDFEWRPYAEMRRPRHVQTPRWVREQSNAWWKESPTTRGRVKEIAERVAVITASANGDAEVTPAGWAAALNFAKWQEKVRTFYAPGQSQTLDGKVTSVILSKIEHHREDDGTPKWFNWRALHKKTSWNKQFGSAIIIRMRDALVSAGTLLAQTDEEEGEDGKRRKKGKANGNYRLAD